MQEIKSSLHRAFNLINCEIRINKVNIDFIANRLRGISQATVISGPADARPTVKTGANGGEVGRSISVLSIIKDRGWGEFRPVEIVKACCERSTET